MIRKELDPFIASDKFAAAGRQAEEKMAFYLKRFFQQPPGIHVFNHLRLERDGDAAQIDHLLIHEFGLVVIESKSVRGKLQLREDGQWVRRYTDNSVGMASPVIQAQLQAEFLRDELGRATRQPELMQTLPIDVLVAVSDSGEIWWPKSGPLPEVCKADLVAGRIQARIAELQAQRARPWFVGANLDKIGDFLLKAHRPLLPAGEAPAAAVVAAPQPEPPPAPTPTPTAVTPAAPAPVASPVVPELAGGEVPAALAQDKVCGECQSRELEIRYGYSYYFHCRSCQANQPIREKCPQCGEAARVRKKGLEFFLDCPACSAATLFFRNPAAEA
ncbi:MAG: hypothetical protein RIR00_1059 [Pseudomonadota bacterium]|jgi:ssDNA-binding Zn-finger/Zn-ribbon topoisomerase 1